METAKIFQDDEGQAVQLPKEYQFAGNQVYVKRVGSAVVLLPYNEPYSVLLESLAEFTDDFMAEREQPTQPAREDYVA